MQTYMKLYYPFSVRNGFSLLLILLDIIHHTHLGVSWAGFLLPLLSVSPPDLAVTQVNTFLKPTLSNQSEVSIEVT